MISFAPMEGIGTCYYRRVHHRLFPEGIDRFYTPFLSVYPNLAFRKRDLREIRPAAGECPEDTKIRRMLVPQILARNAKEILWAAQQLSALGFSMIDLNMGCPSGTVVGKGGGAGMLSDPGRLDRMLGEVFSDPDFAASGVTLSVKTRLGLSDPEEFFTILPVLSKYPLREIIVHPRVRAEQYSGHPHRELLRRILWSTQIPVGYSGDLFTAEDVHRFRDEFPEIPHILLGRGIVSDPSLARQCSGGAPLSVNELKSFVQAVTTEYEAVLDNERQLLLKLKELWYYMGALFVSRDGSDTERLLRNLRGAASMSEYRNALYALFEKCTLGGHFSGIA